MDYLLGKKLNRDDVFSLIMLLSISLLNTDGVYKYILVGVSLLLILLMAAIKQGRNIKIKINVYVKLLFLIIFLNFLALIINGRFESALFYNLLLLYVILVPIFLSNFSINLNNIIYSFFVINLILNILVAIGIPSISFYDYAGDNVFKGLYYDKNGCATILVLGIPYFINNFQLNKKTRNLLYIMITSYLIIITKSTTAFYMVFVLFILMLLDIKVLKRLVRIFPFILVVFIGYIFFYEAIFNSSFADWFFQITGKNLSLSGRISIWRYSIEMFAEHPLIGYGFQGIWSDSLYFEYTKTVLGYQFIGNHAHNGYIETILSIGIIGCILVAFLFIKYYSKLINNINSFNVPKIELVFFVYFIYVNFLLNQMLSYNLYWFILLLYISENKRHNRVENF